MYACLADVAAGPFLLTLQAMQARLAAFQAQQKQQKQP
jgi:hypothetical protein